ncbi:MAG: O-antigen ligase family protein [Candidatus Eisenbacteria bacterium]|nr:O-antigen ligase family protein [Candidatus Eisenbacteria bacterium]
MSVSLRPVRALVRPATRWLDRLVAAATVVVAGVVLGLQYIAPNKRVLASLAALVLFGMAWRIDMLSGIGILALVLPFPRGTVFGSTNLAFVLLLLVIWLLRVTQRQSALPRGTPVDLPVVALFTIYVVSFYNVDTTEHLRRALEYFELMVACMLLFYLVVQNVRTEADLKRVLAFQSVSVLFVCLVAIYELNHPGGTFIPGWIDFKRTVGTEFNTRNVRVGSTFFDYELLSEYCALNLLLAIFMFMRAGALLGKLAYGTLITIVTFVLFATTTRGSIVSLAVGAVYFIWLVRRRVNAVNFVITIAGVSAGFLAMNYYVAHFTRSGDVLARLTATKFTRGIPDSRTEAWPAAWQRLLEHPLIGHGPFYSSEHGIKVWTWPHSLYLYVGNNVGFIGLAVFLYFLWRLWRLSSPPSDDLGHADYAKAYLLIAHVQVVTFIVDQIKIEFMRNPVYQFQVWLMFAFIVAAWQITNRPLVPAAVAAGRARPA